MKHIISFVLILWASLGFSQVLNPVNWDFEINKLSDSEFELVYTAKIKKNWTVYSQFTGDEGPVPTSITYEKMDGAELIGKGVESGHKKEGIDKIFEVNVIKYLDDKPFVIRQKIKVTDPNQPIVGYLTYMTCDNTRCLPPQDIDFTFKIPTSKTAPPQPREEAAAPEKTKTASPEKKTLVLNAQPGTVVQGDEEPGLLDPVQWTIENKTEADGSYSLVFTAAIEPGWSVYSQYTSDDGPVPTSITYENKDGVTLIGDAVESGHKKEGPDPVFDGVNVVKFLHDQPFVLRQAYSLLDSNMPLTGYLTYMTCNDKTCLPPQDVEFSFYAKATESFQPLEVDGMIDQRRQKLLDSGQAPLSDCGDQEEKSTSLWWLLIAGILGGFAAILTPCVFPMIPITVSFFTKDTKRKGWMNGAIYGLSIISIYVILGLIITMTVGPEALNALSTSWIANLLFFAIFMFFAFSFFGFYEITLPSSWSTKSDSLADKGGLLGIFFMAATLAIVSFSCTGPIVGSALVAAAKGGIMGPLTVMFGFSFALALPFGLFAAFPAWLNSLPRSGGWMNSVKVVLGFLEVAFAFKFLSTADLTEGWGILKYETFMAILIIVSALIAIYLFGFIKFPHDSKNAKISLTRKSIGTTFLLLGAYLCLGFTTNKQTGIYNSLWLTSGFSPPVNYNLFLEKESVDESIKAKYPSFTKCANNIDCFKDYYEGMAYAKEKGVPAFLDFTGHGCQNCRRTEDNIWVDERVRTILNDDVVLISLYVDERKPLDVPFTSLADKKKKRTVGNQWADFQIVNFNKNSQPLYVMVTPEEEVITNPRGYEEGIESYLKYLTCGLGYFNANKSD